MKIAYFGFDLFVDCLESILQNKHNILKIFTCNVDGDYEKNVQTYNLAKEYNIPITENKVTNEMIYELEKLDCELIISAGYYYKIPISTIIPSINVHPSPLPIGRGPWPQPWVILKNMQYSAVTLHKLDKSFDTGDIILQQQIKIDINENLVTLTDKSVHVATNLLNEFLTNPKQYLCNAQRQINGEYWEEPGYNEMTFSLNDTYENIDRITRAFYGYKCYCKICEKVIEIKYAKCVKFYCNINEKIKEKYTINDGYLLVLE